MKRVLFLDDARADLRKEHKYYERQQRGLGIRFTQKVRESVRRLADDPEAMQTLAHNIRRWPVRGFPHGVLYRLEADHILVIAVFHPSLHPNKWQGRI